MFSVLDIFVQKELESYLNSHPFKKKFILRKLKKSQISFEEKYYIHLKSRIHGNFWITEKHLLPIISSQQPFSIIIGECPICSCEHHLNEDVQQILEERCPSLIQDFKYIALQANRRAKKIYIKSLAIGKNKNTADIDYTDAYIIFARELINDPKRGEIFFFPDIKSS